MRVSSYRCPAAGEIRPAAVQLRRPATTLYSTLRMDVDARQILFATGGIVALDHSTHSRLFERRGGRTLRARIDLDEIEDGNAGEHQAPEDYQVPGITAFNTLQMAPPLRQT